MSLPGVDAMHQAFATAERSVFRIETLQCYGNSGEDARFAAFLDGTYHPSRDSEYQRILAERTARGVVWQRVHIITEPLTDYMAFELCEYATNVANGEDVRIVAVPEDGRWPENVPTGLDFWLVDETTRFDLLYGTDGSWHGAYPSTNTAAIRQAHAIRTAALAEAVPWANYLTNNHPHLSARLDMPAVSA